MAITTSRFNQSFFMLLHLVTIFISAFLLFQVQPFIAKVILPLFGGGAAVWTSCMLFFQGALLLGYLYAHCLAQLKSTKAQLLIHAGLLLLSLAWLPNDVAALKSLPLSGEPLGDIVYLLALAVGLPYFALSATGPLVQHWLALSNKIQPPLGASAPQPYRLYSLSNAGSLLALISYPFIIEPLMSLSFQGQYWSFIYSFFVIGFILLLWQFYQKFGQEKSNQDQVENVNQSTDNSAISFNRRLSQGALWLLLSAFGVILLIATTNAMSQNVPPVPFLWILPLAIYLITFIIAFDNAKWYIRWYWFAFFILSAFAGIIMHFIGSQFDIVSQLFIYSFILLASCMICHGELANLKPETKRLTQFYLLMSLGGFLGSLLVSILAPQLFSQFTEFPLAIIGTLVLFIACLSFNYQSSPQIGLFKKPTVFSVLALITLGFILLFTQLDGLFNRHIIAQQRNFYGLLSVVDVEVNGKQERRLIDGTTSHGTQALTSNLALTPKSYYRENTGVALALEQPLMINQTIMPKHVGFIGLGAGTLAAYGQLGERYHFFELNPAVVDYAQQYFSYLADSKAEFTISLGDGRLQLQQQLNDGQSAEFDVLVLDAFSGDAIPAHLLTQEAFSVYWQHLKPNGILAMHISNSHLDLTGLSQSLARSVDRQALYFHTPATEIEPNEAQWVIVTNNKSFISSYKVKKYLTPWPINASGDYQSILWTDDYSNLLSVLK